MVVVGGKGREGEGRGGGGVSINCETMADCSHELSNQLFNSFRYHCT